MVQKIKNMDFSLIEKCRSTAQDGISQERTGGKLENGVLKIESKSFRRLSNKKDVDYQGCDQETFQDLITKVNTDSVVSLSFESSFFSDGQIAQILADRTDFKSIIFLGWVISYYPNLDCSLFDEDAVAIAEHIKKNNLLENLDLFINSIGPTGANAIAQVLETNLNIRNLNLAQNEIGLDAARKLCEIAKDRPEEFKMETLILSPQYDKDLGEEFPDLKCLNKEM